MEYCKLQMGCMLIVLYIALNDRKSRKACEVTKKDPVFQCFLGVGILEILFDGATAYTVNHIDTIAPACNRIFHLFFLWSLDAMVFLMFLYIMEITGGIPKQKKKRICIIAPFAVALVLILWKIPQLTYVRGEYTNYSLGVSVYVCYVALAMYLPATLVVLYYNRKNIVSRKAATIATYLSVSICIAVAQMIEPELLITCLFPTMAIVGSYLNMENPLYTRLKSYHREMVMGFATLVENRDDNTGGHIRRTTEYIRLLADEMRRRGIYREKLDAEYVNHLVMAAPMHDIGKIAIPDAILQKPGRLTAEEYEIMKGHAYRGGQMIKETFGNVGDPEYEEIAYQVARHHHEKWNGTGYPDGLAGQDIPLAARIMAVADVFDAVSAKRCYRDAMTIEDSLSIIREGIGKDFDPAIAETFLELEPEVRRICACNKEEK